MSTSPLPLDPAEFIPRFDAAARRAGFKAQAYDVYVLDINLKDWSGLELLRRLRIERPGARVVIFSMYSEIAYAMSARRAGALERWPDLRPVAFLARISYAVFLVHFPVYLLVSAAFEHFGSESSGVAALALAIGWCASIAAGVAFHRGVELRAAGGAAQRLRTTMPTSAAMPVCCVPSRSSAS